MESPERRQLHDEIVDETVDIDGLSLEQLKGLIYDLDHDYMPSEAFWFMIRGEIRRKEQERALSLGKGFYDG